MAGRKCTVCTHAQAAEINKLLVANRSFRVIASQFSLTQAAVGRHSINCVGEMLDKAREAQVLQNAIDTENEASGLFSRIKMQIEMAHDWLADPNDPAKYTLAPRADNVSVVYYDATDKDSNGKPKRKHGDLQELLFGLDKAGYDVDRVKLPKVNYSGLMLDAMKEAVKFLDLIASLRGEKIKDKKNPLDKEDLVAKVMIAQNCERPEAIAWLKEKYSSVREFKELR